MHAIEAWIRAQDGLLARIYVDEGESGRTLDRPAFQQMRRDARQRKFDALVVHKFDRFARNRTDALTTKSLLRQSYGVKVFSVTEPSQDSDGPWGALIEGIMESVADWYSQNLAAEVAKGKRERARQGLHNNSPSFGLTKSEAKVLVPDDDLPGLLLAFKQYATARYSDRDVAHLLHEAGYRSKSGRPFCAETVRAILQNRVYLGEVKYQKYKRRADGSRSYEGEVEWFKGQHEPVIDVELFERCQQVRRERASHCQATERYNPYLLRNLAYCWRCCTNPPAGKAFQEFGKMRCQAQAKGRYRYYRCQATDLGYSCEQKGVRVSVIDPQVIACLKQFATPVDWRQRATRAMEKMLGEQNLEERIAELKAMIRRMDLRWDNGFITDERDYGAAYGTGAQPGAADADPRGRITAGQG